MCIYKQVLEIATLIFHFKHYTATIIFADLLLSLIECMS